MLSVNDFRDILFTFSQPSTSRTGGNKTEALRSEYVTTVHLLRHRTENDDGFFITSPVSHTAEFHISLAKKSQGSSETGTTLRTVSTTVTYCAALMRRAKCMNVKSWVKIKEQREERRDA
jgi:hypothetical protein